MIVVAQKMIALNYILPLSGARFKQSLWPQILTALLVLHSTASGDNLSPKAHIDRSVDLLCRQTGLVRIGKIKMLKSSEYSDAKYWIEVPLRVERSTHLYTALLDDHFSLIEFKPGGWPEVAGGLLQYSAGYDAYHNRAGREVALAAVNQFRRIRGVEVHGRPALQKVGSDVVVTYRWSSQHAERHGTLYKDAVLSFIVNPRGMVIGEFWGSWPTKKRLPE